MKPAVSDIALPGPDYRALLPQVRGLGFLGLEVAPCRIAPGTAAERLTAGQVEASRRAVESAGMQIAGLHGLLAGRPDLGIFADREAVARTVDHFVLLAGLCRDLGGSVMIFGAAGRRRGALPLKSAWLAARAFLEELLPRIEDFGVVLCFSPLGKNGDFGATAAECRVLADALDHPAIGLQMDSWAQVENSDTGHAPFSISRGRLEQFQVSDPGLAVPDPAGPGRHADFRRHLATVGFQGWLTLKQRAGAFGGMVDLVRGAQVLQDVYLRQDSHPFVPPHRPHSFAQAMRVREPLVL